MFSQPGMEWIYDFDLAQVYENNIVPVDSDLDIWYIMYKEEDLYQSDV